MITASDEKLMVQYQQGSVAAFDLLYLRYESRVYGYLLRLVRDRDRAAELFQETFLNLHKHRHSFDKDKPFSPWLFRISRNLAYNEIRQTKRRRKVFENQVDLDAQVNHQQKNPEEALQSQSLKEQLDSALCSLPEDQREALVLSYYGGLKYADIAEVMGTTQDAIKQRVRRGMVKLRDRFHDLLRSDTDL